MKSGGILSGAAVMLSACATAQPLPLAPVLEYSTGQDCIAALDLTLAHVFDPEAKGSKSMLRSRTIDLRQDMTLADCLERSDGGHVPYALFRIPDGYTGRVITAGSEIDSNSLFASDVSVLDEAGNVVREFAASDYRRMGNRYGVQFSPAESESFVLIKAEPALVGQNSRTMETSISSQSVYVPVGTYVGHGTNTVGQTTAYSRAFSYDGFAGIRVTYPKQAKS